MYFKGFKVQYYGKRYTVAKEYFTEMTLKIKHLCLLCKRQRCKYTSAVPLLFRISPALVCAVSGAPGAAYCKFGALLRGDMNAFRLLPCTNRQLSDGGDMHPPVLICA